MSCINFKTWVGRLENTRFSTCIARGFQDIKQLQGDASHFIVYECGAGKEIAVFSSRQGNFQSLKNDDGQDDEE